jgi:TRAP-type C4-dicarboxylate transport system permease small subunit
MPITSSFNREFMKVIKKVYELLLQSCDALQYLGALALVSGAVIVFVEVVVRQFSMSLFVLDELGGIGMLIVALTGAAAIFRQGRHIRITLLLNRLPGKIHVVLEFFDSILAVCFAAYLTYLWWEMAYRQFESKTYFLMTHIPVWSVQVVLMLAWLALTGATLEYVVVRAKAILHVCRKLGGRKGEQ